MILAATFVLFLLGSYVAYTESVRESPYYLSVYVGLNILTGVTWVLGTKGTTKEAIYEFSMYWDTLMIVAYYFVPLLLLGVRPNWPTVLGMLFIVFGFTCVRWGGE